MAILAQDKKDGELTSGMNDALGQSQGQQGQPQDPQLSTESAVSNTSTPVGAGLNTPPSPGTPASTQVNPKAGSGSFTNIRQYIKANEGNRVASAASQQLQRTGQQAQKNIATGTQEFNKRAEAGSLQNRGTAVQDVKNIVQQARNVDVTNMPVKQQATAQAAPQAPAQQPAQAPTMRTAGPATRPGTLPAGVEKQVIASTAAPKSTGKSWMSRITGAINAAKKAEEAKATAAQAPAEAPKAAQTATDMYGDLLQGADTKRFQDIINAQYAGPQSLRQAGMLDPIEKRVNQAQSQLNQAGTAQGREQLLRNLFGQNREYTQGQNKLDALLLNTDKAGVQNVLDQKQDVGNLKNQMMQAQLGSASTAQNLTNEINSIRDAARKGFITEQQAEKATTEARIKNAQAQGNQYYDMMSKVLAPKANKQVDMSAKEQELLGIRNNEQLFNVKNLPKEQLMAAQMISKNEQARQEALARLAGLDTSKQLDTNLKYADATKAGTQKVTDSVNTEKLRQQLGMSQEEFSKWAKGADIVGEGKGSAKYSKGLFKGKGTVKATAENKQHIGDLLKEAGYDFSPEEIDALSTDESIYKTLGMPIPGAQAVAGQDLGKGQVAGQGIDLLGQGLKGYGSTKGLMDLSTTAATKLAQDQAYKAAMASALEAGATQSMAAEYAAAQSAGASGAGMGGPVAAAIALATDADLREAAPELGSMAQDASLELATLGAYDKNSDLGKYIGFGQDIQKNITGDLLSSADFAGSAVDELGESFGIGGVGSSIFGGGKSAARKKAQREAQINAAKDAQKQILESLAAQGFDRRAGVVDTKAEKSKLGDITGNVKTSEANIANFDKDQKTIKNLLDDAGLKHYQINTDPNAAPQSQIQRIESGIQGYESSIADFKQRLQDPKASSKAKKNYNRIIKDQEAKLAAAQKALPLMQKYADDSGNMKYEKMYKKEQSKLLSDYQAQQKAQQQRLGETKAVDSRTAQLEAFLKNIDRTNY